MTNENTEIITADEVAAMLRVAPATVYRWAAAGKLQSIRFEGTVRFRRSDAEALLEPKAAS